MIIYYFLVLIFAIILHELAHGYTADQLGDPTARQAGRLTLNPLAHLDPFGSLLLPALLILFHSPILIGWAKPVPYNPFNLKNPKKDSVIIALAGPLTNLFLVFLFWVLRKITLLGYLPLNSSALWEIGIQLNLILAIFNLLPIPPLDGSKVLQFFIKEETYYQLEMMGFILVILFLMIFGAQLASLLDFLMNIILNI